MESASQLNPRFSSRSLDVAFLLGLGENASPLPGQESFDPAPPFSLRDGAAAPAKPGVLMDRGRSSTSIQRGR